jgi:protoheme IX farnesyltransferase
MKFSEARILNRLKPIPLETVETPLGLTDSLSGLQLRAPEIDRPKTLFAMICDLIKARLTSLVLLTTLVGFYMGTKGTMDFGLMFNTLMGTALVACGGSALNQLFEREQDAKMHRTHDRPLPSGRMRPRTVLLFGISCSVLGLLQLALLVNLLTFALSAITLSLYAFIYTPLKRVSWLNTIVGAVPGALPPLMGWTAAQNQLGPGGTALFAIQFFWQISHFMAIAWMYRDEYENAGFVMLPNVDPLGVRTSRLTVINTFGLLGVSLLPVLYDSAGMIYLAGALALGVAFLCFAIQFARNLTLRCARWAFLASIAYLPALLGLLVYDKLKP